MPYGSASPKDIDGFDTDGKKNIHILFNLNTKKRSIKLILLNCLITNNNNFVFSISSKCNVASGRYRIHRRRTGK